MTHTEDTVPAGHGASCTRWPLAVCEIIPSFPPGEWERAGGVRLEEPPVFGAMGAGRVHQPRELTLLLVLRVTWAQQPGCGSVMLEGSAACSWPRLGGLVPKAGIFTHCASS